MLVHGQKAIGQKCPLRNLIRYLLNSVPFAHINQKSSESVTRGNAFKIINRRCHYDLRKYSFCNRVTNLWNSLPDVVVTAPSLNTFKNRKHWINQHVLYVWHAEISGTGSRSNIFRYI